MRSMSQGGPSSEPAEYSERAKYKSVTMQHVLPSRNVCVAYRGMTIPLPAPSLCGAFHKPLLTSKAPEGGSKDSGFHSQCTTVSDVSCNTDSVTTSPGLGGSQRKGDDHNDKDEKMGGEICDVNSDEVDSDLKMSIDGESNAGACWLGKCSSEMRPPHVSPGKVVETPVSSPVWAGTGRGRLLLSRLSPAVGSGLNDARMNIGVSAAHGNGTTAQNHLRHSFSEDAKLDGSINAEPLGVAEVGIYDDHLSCGTSATSSNPVGPQNENNDIVNGEMERGAVSGMKYTSPVELVHNTTDLTCLSVSCAEYDVLLPDKQIEGQTTSEARTDKSLPQGPEILTNTSPAKTPPRSLRKSKVSLAIQFKGGCSLQSVTQRDASPSVMPQGAVLLKPSDFTLGVEAVKTEGVTADVEVGGKEIEMSDCAQDSVKDVEKERVCEGSPEEVQTLVSDVKDFDQICSLSRSDDSPEAKGEDTLQHQHRYLSPARTLSSDEDVVECTEARMGRSANEMEKSIALHQRNIHRNRMELRRVQKKNKATEEMLAGDLADQCHEDLLREDSLQYSTTGDREARMDRVVDLQLQFSIHSEAAKRRSAEYMAILEQGNTAYKNDKLACMELQLEVEAMEMENQLMLDKVKSQLLKAKSELLYD